MGVAYGDGSFENRGQLCPIDTSSQTPIILKAPQRRLSPPGPRNIFCKISARIEEIQRAELLRALRRLTPMGNCHRSLPWCHVDEINPRSFWALETHLMIISYSRASRYLAPSNCDSRSGFFFGNRTTIMRGGRYCCYSQPYGVSTVISEKSGMVETRAMMNT
ncbi:hypothetical protein BJV78DRAFT_451986 [Lactifluus subvellereus]|nr:hypothetical protein BJV78DRAFT_451986 [Lactifluus subvellereus]